MTHFKGATSDNSTDPFNGGPGPPPAPMFAAPMPPPTIVEEPEYSKWQCRVHKRHVSTNTKELSIEEGDLVEVLKNEKKWWSVRNIQTGVKGFVPSNYLSTMQGQSATKTLPIRRDMSSSVRIAREPVSKIKKTPQ